MATLAKAKQNAHIVQGDDVNFLRNTVAQGATDEELKMLLYLSKEYGLDPLKKEIYFIKYGGRSTIITSRDGYLKIANRNENFNGLESDVVYQGDKLTKRDDGSIHIEYSEAHLAFDKIKLVGAFCSVFRKDRAKATTIFVSIKDYYKKDTPIWDQYINAMILKVAEAMALKRAFAISGLVTREEIEKEGFELEQEAEFEKMATEAQRKAIFVAAHNKHMTEEAIKQLLVRHFNKTTTKDLTQDEASQFISLLHTL